VVTVSYEQTLLSILAQATGRPGEIAATGTAYPSGRTFWPGCSVKFADGPKVIADRVGMWAEGTEVRVGVWPAELKPQYTLLYSDPVKVANLLTLGSREQWHLHPNFHLAYRFAGPTMRWYPERSLTAADYIHQWVTDFTADRAGGRTREQVDDSRFRQWLVDRRYASADEIPTLDTWLSGVSSKIQFNVRPSIEVTRSWSADALALDQRREFVADVRHTVDQILTALGQPTLGEQPVSVAAAPKPKKAKATKASAEPPPKPKVCARCFTQHAGDECY
jgi:O-acetyl-ADP-ribose deacetylase